MSRPRGGPDRKTTLARLGGAGVGHPTNEDAPSAIVDSPKMDEALRKFEESAGGRQQMLEVLAPGANNAARELIVGALADPRNDGRSLATICKMLGIGFGTLLLFFRDAGFAQAQMEASRRIWKMIPDVAEDAFKRALPSKEKCKDCFGVGRWQEPDPDKPGEQREHACTTCGGDGEITIEPSVARQRLALEMGGVVKTGGVSINVNQGQAITFGAEHLREFRMASDRILYPSRQGQVQTVETQEE